MFFVNNAGLNLAHRLPESAITYRLLELDLVQCCLPSDDLEAETFQEQM